MAPDSPRNHANNAAGSQENRDSEGVPSTGFITCRDCGREVPENNVTIHQLRACPGRARRPGQPQLPSQCLATTNSSEGSQPMDVDEEESQSSSSSSHAKKNPPSPNPVVMEGGDDDDEVIILNENPTMPVATLSGQNLAPSQERTGRTRDYDGMGTPQRGLRRRRRRESSLNTNIASSSSSPNPEIGSINGAEVIDLVGITEPGQSQQAQVHQSTEPPEINNQWACPQCTLHNPKTIARCEACLFPNPERPPDPTRRERLIDESDEAGASPLAFVSGGALMGGILGAAGSILHGRDPLSGAAEGAMTGGIGGAFLNGVLTANGSPSGRRRSETPLTLSQARTSASITGGYPSFGGNSSSNRMRPRASFRVVSESGENDSTTTVVMGGTGSTRIRRSNRGGVPQMPDDQMMSLLMHSYLQGGGGMGELRHQIGRQQPNIDGMTYEQLIAAFGDGTENMGATAGQIQQLPIKTIVDPEKELPEDARQCLICLEDFAGGDSRMILPCLHGFHAECCRRWLETNGSCPICKHRIR